MGRRLRDNITSGYFEAANRLAPKRSRRRVVAYVESYDDVFFWRTVLGRFENEHIFFEVMLPSKGALSRGKKSVLMSVIAGNAGCDMIACVDADYDYMLQGVTPTSCRIIKSPYVFHTYAYSIENYQCFAPALHDVCVMVTLNDHSIFDFDDYMRQYSEACHPLFVWSVWAYRTGNHGLFSISDFCGIITPGGFNVFAPHHSLNHLRHKVERKVRALRQGFPDGAAAYPALEKELSALGVTPQNTYLYIQGHHIFDSVVAPIMSKVCNLLRQEREREIHSTATHRTQMRNELSCYENSIEDVRSMLKKNTGYTACPQFQALQADVARFVSGIVSKYKSQETSPSRRC